MPSEACCPSPFASCSSLLPFAEIERRLAAAVTAGRAEDLQEAARQSGALDSQRDGAVVPDLLVANDVPVREVADEIVEWLGWR